MTRTPVDPEGAERLARQLIKESVRLYRGALEHGALTEDGRFKPEPALRALFEGHGVTDDKDVITYCAVGMRSAHTWFVLSELLGYPRVRSYDGSWNEWGRLPDTPIERAQS